MRRLATLLSVLLVVGGGAGLAVASGGGASDRGAAHVQYGEKPGCGPDKSDGVAGKSGRHTGQPPKAPDRGDCPNPPGQQ